MSKKLRNIIDTDQDILTLREKIRKAEAEESVATTMHKNNIYKLNKELESLIKSRLPSRPEIITLEWLMDQDWPLANATYNLYNEMNELLHKEYPEITSSGGFWQESRQIGLALNSYNEWKPERVKRCLDLCKPIQLYHDLNYRGGGIEFGPDREFMIAKKENGETYEILSSYKIVCSNVDFNKVFETALKVNNGDVHNLEWL